ncbi:HAD-IA family hydrolase [Paenibacillus sp. OV219]|uniref:HAD-IA family hydrolase n=1 Tax=Paenibacillus sp. OV219 TaxID=1884377 RepID=UPI0008BE2607|nr:HAD-IA family hydrolase [Paenibacillus sp. OV219]SEO74804.1 putative hydrolase of the HAD superfamily [Paenibacillus sp. OV219]
MSRLQVVLDAGGVIVTNLPELWKEIAEHADLPIHELKECFNVQLRSKLWTGESDEEAFWQWMTSYYPGITTADGRAIMARHLRVLPAYHRIQAWSEFADIHVLSNHRHEWLMPLLVPIQPYLTSVTISSQAGSCKPSLPIYKLVQSKLRAQDPVVFVDDSERNLVSARELGWKTLLADEQGAWMGAIDVRL